MVIDSIDLKIPPGYKVSTEAESLICGLSTSSSKDSEWIANFLIIPTRLANYTSTDGIIFKKTLFFKLWIAGVLSEKEYEQSLNELENLNFFALDQRCILSPKRKSAKSEVIFILKYNLSGMEPIKIEYFNRLGWTKFHGEHAYVAGNRLVSSSGFISSNQVSLSHDFHAFNLVLDEGMTKFDTINYIHRLMNVEPNVSSILVSNMFTGLLRSLYIDAGIPPSFLIFIQALPQSGKSTLASLSSLQYGSTIGLFNLISTGPSMQKDLSDFRDCTIIFDDLYNESNRQGMKKRELALSEIIRIVGNNSPRQKQEGNQTKAYSPSCSVVCTAEYNLKDLSTLARCIVLRLSSPLDKKKLLAVQNEPKGMSTAVFYFITWCCGNYDKIVDDIRQSFYEFRKSRSSTNNQNERIHENLFFLRKSMDIFWRYAMDVDPSCEEAIRQSREGFKEILNTVFAYQSKLLNLCNGIENDIGRTIFQLIQNRVINVKKGGHYAPGYDGIIKRDTVCLHPARITSALNRYGYSITEQQLIHTLRRQDLLLKDASGKSTKKIDGVRLLHIPLTRIYPSRI